MTFQMLPPARSWPPDAEKLAQALAAGARRPTTEAGVALLLRLDTSFWARADLARYYTPAKDGHALEVQWGDLETALDDYALPASQGEHAAVALAASMAGEAEVELEWALGFLTAELLEEFLVAARHAAGQSTEDGDQ